MSTAGELGFALQTARGAPAAQAAFRVLYASTDSPGPALRIRPSPETGVGILPRDAYAAPVRVEGGAVAIARPDFLGLLLRAALGAEAISGAADPYTHTFTVANALPWLTIWRSVAGLLHERFDDCRLRSLRITSRAGQAIIVAFEVLGVTARHKASGQAAGAVDTGIVMLHSHAAGALLVEGAAVAAISEWELLIDTGAVFLPYPNGEYVGRTAGRVVLSTLQRVTSGDLWRRVHYGSASPADNAPAVATPLVLGGSPAGIRFTVTPQAAPERSLRLDLPSVVVTGLDGYSPDPAGSPTIARVTYEPQSLGGEPITVTLKNSVSTLYQVAAPLTAKVVSEVATGVDTGRSEPFPFTKLSTDTASGRDTTAATVGRATEAFDEATGIDEVEASTAAERTATDAALGVDTGISGPLTPKAATDASSGVEGATIVDTGIDERARVAEKMTFSNGSDVIISTGIDEVGVASESATRT